jgi:hypothetical protein
MKAIAREYIKKALRAKIAEKRPDYASKVIETVVSASMDDGIYVSKDVLYRAIEMAANDAKQAEQDAKQFNAELIELAFAVGVHIDLGPKAVIQGATAIVENLKKIIERKSKGED